MPTKYDNWLTTTPEDEEDAEILRRAKKDELDQRRLEAIDEDSEVMAPYTSFARMVWDPVKKCAVIDTRPVKVYPEDYIYDPMRGKE